jgi:hypothetical protein
MLVELDWLMTLLLSLLVCSVRTCIHWFPLDHLCSLFAITLEPMECLVFMVAAPSVFNFVWDAATCRFPRSTLPRSLEIHHKCHH